MPRTLRSNAVQTAEIPASAQEVYDLVADWGGLLRWFPKEFPVPVTRVELEGSEDLPLTRILHTADGGAIRETLLRRDPQMRRLYFLLPNENLPGIANYMVTVTVDEVGPQRAFVTYAAIFDVVDTALGEQGSRELIQGVYALLLGGIAGYFASRR